MTVAAALSQALIIGREMTPTLRQNLSGLYGMTVKTFNAGPQLENDLH